MHTSGSWQLHAKVNKPFARGPAIVAVLSEPAIGAAAAGRSKPAAPGKECRSWTPSLRPGDTVELRCVSLSFSGEVWDSMQSCLFSFLVAWRTRNGNKRLPAGLWRFSCSHASSAIFSMPAAALAGYKTFNSNLQGVCHLLDKTGDAFDTASPAANFVVLCSSALPGEILAGRITTLRKGIAETPGLADLELNSLDTRS